MRNLTDGRVELVVEGSAAEANRLLEDLREHFGSMIHSADSNTTAATGEHPDFRIRR